LEYEKRYPLKQVSGTYEDFLAEWSRPIKWNSFEDKANDRIRFRLNFRWSNCCTTGGGICICVQISFATIPLTDEELDEGFGIVDFEILDENYAKIAFLDRRNYDDKGIVMIEDNVYANNEVSNFLGYSSFWLLPDSYLIREDGENEFGCIIVKYAGSRP
jgi:hypothetical protein